MNYTDDLMNPNLTDYLPIHKNNYTFTESEIQDALETYLIHEILLIVILLVAAGFGTHIIKKRNIRILNESLFCVLVGLVAGLFLYLSDRQKYINSLTQGYLKVFIIILLPPIIFESAFNMNIRVFFKNLGTILIYAILGTCISIVVIGFGMYYLGTKGVINEYSMRETLAFGSLISATDPVCILAAFKEYTTDPNFFLIVFGESILNDAVSMVFYDTIAEGGNHQGENHGFASVVYQFFYILIGSTIIGLLIGFISSAILKKITEGDKNSQRIEVGTMVSLPWIAYLASHISSFSGIVVIFFIGIGSAMYTRSYIKEHTREIVSTIYEEAAHLFETIVFLFIGIAFFAEHPYEDMSKSLSIIVILLCLIGRFLNIIICSYLSNLTRSNKSWIDWKKQFFLWFAGVRGAMAFALSLKSKFDFPGTGNIFLLLTLLITAFTLIYSSLMLEPILHACGIIEKDEKDKLDNDDTEEKNNKNYFELFKNWLVEINETHFMPYVSSKDKGINNNSKLLNDLF